MALFTVVQHIVYVPSSWKNVVLHERAMGGSVYALSWGYSVVQYYPINAIRHNEHHHHSTLCRAHFLWTRKIGMLHSFDWRFKFGSYERAQVSFIATICPRKPSPSLWYLSNKISATAKPCHCYTSEISRGILRSASLR